jgi:hypothetical protein
MSHDCLDGMLTEIRGQRPPIWDADRRTSWINSIGQLIAGMSNVQQQVTAIDAVALDLCGAYGLPRDMARMAVIIAVCQAEERYEKAS